MSKDTNISVDICGLVGMVWAGILSYLKWHSLGWAVLHTLFGWIYVIYYFIRF